MTLMKEERFNWNPFSMFGEAPYGVRFKTDVDDLEFATKEDLEAIKADPRLLKLHQAMTSGVTKKFQGFADEKKQFAKTMEALQAQVAELDGSLQEWENWYITNQKVLSNPGKGNDDPNPKKGKDNVMDGDEKMWEKKFEQLITAVNQAGGQFERKLTHMGKMLSLSMQMNDLYRKNPKMDGDKVLDAALQSGSQNLNDVYNEVYHDDILNQQVEERLTPRLEEEITKRMTKVESGSGATPMKFEIPKETPKTWTDAGQEFLVERAKEAAKP